jgi:hypothetical protein
MRGIRLDGMIQLLEDTEQLEQLAFRDLGEIYKNCRILFLNVRLPVEGWQNNSSELWRTVILLINCIWLRVYHSGQYIYNYWCFPLCFSRVQ